MSGRPLEIPGAVEWLRNVRGSDSTEFIWLHFNLTVAPAQETRRSRCCFSRMSGP